MKKRLLLLVICSILVSSILTPSIAFADYRTYTANIQDDVYTGILDKDEDTDDNEIVDNNSYCQVGYLGGPTGYYRSSCWVNGERVTNYHKVKSDGRWWEKDNARGAARLFLENAYHTDRIYLQGGFWLYPEGTN